MTTYLEYGAQEFYINEITDTQTPTISDAYISDQSENGFTINCHIDDNISVKGVWVNTLMPNNEWNNIWVPVQGNGDFSYRINAADYAGQGTYEVSLWIYDYFENATPYGFEAVNVIGSDFGFSKYIVRNGHIYAFCDNPLLNWKGAKVYSEQAGGHLVTISDQAENDFVHQNLNEKECFIGFNDIQEENNFIWVNGEDVDYTNWNEGEPNNVGDNEDVAYLRLSDGKWADCADHTYSTVGFVTEFEPEIVSEFSYNGNRYRVYDIAPTWITAKDFCEELGGHLATITDNGENYALSNHIPADIPCYLGASDAKEEGVWEWITGEAFEYTNWNESEPNNTNNIENVIETSFSGTWNDIPDNYTRGFICEFESNLPKPGIELA